MKFRLNKNNFNWMDILAVILPLTFYFILTIPLFNWVIDDAGISYVYARNLASGHGLVSQPGLEPVEGYSNPLWIFLLTPFFAAGVFDPFIVPKVISLLLVGVSFYFLHRVVQLLTDSKFLISLIVLSFIVGNTAFVAWTCSGLENALLVALVSALLYMSITTTPAKSLSKKKCIVAGLIAGGIALTRPDGLVYLIVFPIAALLANFPPHRQKLVTLIKLLSVFFVTFAATYGSYLFFRLLYFHNIFPNTYHAKGGPTFSIVLDALTLQQFYSNKLQEILQSIFGAKLWVLIPVIIFIRIIQVSLQKKSFWRELVLIITVSISVFTYLIVINDWMGEYRLATVFFPLLYALLGIAVYQSVSALRVDSKIKIAVATFILILLAVGSLKVHSRRLSQFIESPPVSFASVGERYGAKFNHYADSLGLTNASFLLSDIGGALYYSELRIYDFAGLCDPIIARTMRQDRPRFLDYIFEEVKPTFIHTHGWFTTTARFHEDARFQRDYVAILEYEDKYAEERLKRKIKAGNYVRRDALTSGSDNTTLNK